MASRPTRSGKEALAVLQDALMVHYGDAFRSALRKARRKAIRGHLSDRVRTVIFVPTMERAMRRYREGPTQAFYRRNAWPFVDTLRPEDSRQTAVVVWDSYAGFDAHHWTARRASGRQFVPLYQASQPIASIT